MKDILRKIEQEYQMEDGELDRFDRTCDECGAHMVQGFVIDGGCEYYCSEDCLHKNYTPEEWEEMYGDGNTDNYWTEWEDDYDFSTDTTLSDAQRASAITLICKLDDIEDETISLLSDEELFNALLEIVNTNIIKGDE